MAGSMLLGARVLSLGGTALFWPGPPILAMFLALNPSWMRRWLSMAALLVYLTCILLNSGKLNDSLFLNFVFMIVDATEVFCVTVCLHAVMQVAPPGFVRTGVGINAIMLYPLLLAPLKVGLNTLLIYMTFGPLHLPLFETLVIWLIGDLFTDFFVLYSVLVFRFYWLQYRELVDDWKMTCEREGRKEKEKERMKEESAAGSMGREAAHVGGGLARPARADVGNIEMIVCQKKGEDDVGEEEKDDSDGESDYTDYGEETEEEGEEEEEEEEVEGKGEEEGHHETNSNIVKSSSEPQVEEEWLRGAKRSSSTKGGGTADRQEGRNGGCVAGKGEASYGSGSTEQQQQQQQHHPKLGEAHPLEVWFRSPHIGRDIFVFIFFVAIIILSSFASILNHTTVVRQPLFYLWSRLLFPVIGYVTVRYGQLVSCFNVAAVAASMLVTDFFINEEKKTYGSIYITSFSTLFQALVCPTLIVIVSWSISYLAVALAERQDTLRLLRDKNAQLLAQEKELREAKLAAEDALSSKTEFFARVSHEFRTPLNVVLGFSEELIKPPSPVGRGGEGGQGAMTTITPETADRVQYILAAGESLLRVVDDILELFRLSSTHSQTGTQLLQINLTAVDIPSFFGTVCDLVEVITKENGQHFIKHLDPSLPRYLVIDRGRFSQLVMNLASNACKYSRPAGGVISIRLTNEGPVEDGRPGFITLRLDVQDNGPGIPPELKDRIFESFFRGGPSAEEAEMEAEEAAIAAAAGAPYYYPLPTTVGGGGRDDGIRKPLTATQHFQQQQMEQQEQYQHQQHHYGNAYHPFPSSSTTISSSSSSTPASSPTFTSLKSTHPVSGSHFVGRRNPHPLPPPSSPPSSYPPSSYASLSPTHSAAASAAIAGFHSASPPLFLPPTQQHQHKAKGHGLGLAITKQLVDLLHGRIDVQSSLGLGSLFSIFLPAEIADGCSSEDNMGVHERGGGGGGGIVGGGIGMGGGGGGAGGEAPPVRELKILSVEDILVNQIVLGGMLQQDGHRVVFVETGTAALTGIDPSFDLILLDLQLPDMHGIDVLKTLRGHSDPRLASMPIVVVSALVLDREKQECALAGADGFITKPVKLNLLRKEIRGLWDSGRLRKGGKRGDEEEEEGKEDNGKVGGGGHGWVVEEEVQAKEGMTLDDSRC